MAYGLKYQSDFYNYFKRLISVKIYKRDYEDSEVTSIRTSQVKIQANYQNDNTPIIGTGAKIEIVANSDMTFLEELLLSYERQFMCTVEHNGQIVFRGYSICDLNERQLLPYAKITMQFTDYMHRLEEHYPVSLSSVGGKANVYGLLNELLTLTDLDLPFYINSTLFENSMVNGNTDTFLPQVDVQNAQFYTDAFTYDNIYAAVNKCLQPFSAFLYYYNDRWILERQEDITRTGNWVLYGGGGASSVASLKQEYNKQDGDWEYVNCSQIVEYDSGLKTLILQLQDKKLDSLIFNDYTKDMLTTNGMFTAPEDFPLGGQLDYRTWYAHEDLTGLSVGTDYQDLSTYVHFNLVNGLGGSGQYGYQQGLYYNFAVQFNTATEGDSSGGSLEKETIMNISYKMSTDEAMDDIYKVQLRYLLRLDGGTFSGWWVVQGQSVGQGQIIWLYPPIGAPVAVQPYSTDPANFCCHSAIIDVADEHSTDWSIQKTLNMTGMTCHCEGVNHTYDSLWEALGFPEVQRFTMIFLSPWYSIQENVKPAQYGHIFESVYLGDIAVTITVEDIDNKIEYHLNENFVKTETIDLYLFDLPNINYSNGLLIATNNDSSEADELGTYTRLWTSENSTVACPLYEVFAKSKFRKYCRTIHRLKGTILCDHALKVFSVLTDDNIPSETSSSGNMTFLLNGFTWDIVTGQYDIEAEEYTEEEVVVDGVTYDTEGNPVIEIPSTAPTGLTAYQYTDAPIIYVSWDPIGGAQGYKVQRRPTYYSGYWADFNTEIYRGTGNWVVDQPSLEGDPTGQTFIYRVCAYNSAGDSPWSSDFYLVYT